MALRVLPQQFGYGADGAPQAWMLAKSRAARILVHDLCLCFVRCFGVGGLGIVEEWSCTGPNGTAWCLRAGLIATIRGAAAKLIIKIKNCAWFLKRGVVSGREY